MRKHKALFLVIIVSFLSVSCFEDSDDNQIADRSINDFVWKGMNFYYLYKDNIPNLADDRFTSNADYTDYLNSFSRPEDLFESLIYERETVDRFSWMVDDYIALEQFFAGVTTSNGMEFRLYYQPNSNTQLMGIVRLILPNSSASASGLQRGDIFNAIDGIGLTTNNYESLLDSTSYTVNLATYNDNGTPTITTDDTIVSNGESTSLTKVEYSENPIFETKIFDVDGQNVGYLMYNGFTANFDTQLNDAFGTFKSNNVQHLILDLRYNPGGSVNTAILLSGMITGQFNGDIFSTEQYNNKLQTEIENENPEFLINRFTNNDDGKALNSLNLQKVYIIALKSSASASELVINCLDPYINVVHIGENTEGKYQASITVYDSPTFRREGANPNHSYAMQPLVFKSLNKLGNTDYFDGLTPDIPLSEDKYNLGIIGDENEKLLAAALADIKNPISKFAPAKSEEEMPGKFFMDSNSFEPFNNEMYSDKNFPFWSSN